MMGGNHLLVGPTFYILCVSLSKWKSRFFFNKWRGSLLYNNNNPNLIVCFLFRNSFFMIKLPKNKNVCF